MNKYIDAEKLKAEIEKKKKILVSKYNELAKHEVWKSANEDKIKINTISDILSTITSLQQDQPNNMIQWTGNNLKEVIDFTGKSPRFGEWFKSWNDFENYVHSHDDILKLFCEDGSHYEVPVGAWIVKTPDGYNLPSVSKYIQQEQPEVDLEKEANKWWDYVFSAIGWDENSLIIMNHKEFLAFARHFYELGLNARKEE